MKDLTPEQISAMNIYQKLAEVRTRFREGGVKKSGINTHAEFTYFELEDVVPLASKLFEEFELLFLISFEDGNAVGTLYDTASMTSIRIMAPVLFISEPAKYRMNETQSAGAVQTYYRRYLYFLLLDIVEADKIDAGTADEAADKPKSAPKKAADKPQKTKKPATKEERAEIKEAVTAADEAASELQIEALRLALNKLLVTDPEQEEFVQAVMEKTEGLTKVTKEQAETLTSGISEMLEQYTEEEK